MSLPRPQRRGPIEAPWGWSRRNADCSFRGLSAAAPLIRAFPVFTPASRREARLRAVHVNELWTRGRFVILLIFPRSGRLPAGATPSTNPTRDGTERTMLMDDRCFGDSPSASIRFCANGTLECEGPVTVSVLLRELIAQINLFLLTLEVCERGGDGGYILRAPGVSLHKGLGEIWQRITLLSGGIHGLSLDAGQLKRLREEGGVWINVEPRRDLLPQAELMSVLTFSILRGPDGQFVTALPAATVDRIRGVRDVLALHLNDAQRNDPRTPEATEDNSKDRGSEFQHADDYSWIVFAGVHYTFGKGRSRSASERCGEPGSGVAGEKGAG